MLVEFVGFDFCVVWGTDPKMFFGAALVLRLLCTVQSILNQPVGRTLIRVRYILVPHNRSVVGPKSWDDSAIHDPCFYPATDHPAP